MYQPGFADYITLGRIPMSHSRPRARPSIRRPWLRKQEPLSVATSPHWSDVWLPRLSHFAQFGLFVLTIGSLYFTVIPLYQKAVLEEAIARKEVELAKLNTTLDTSYVRLRRYVVREYYIAATPPCSGLFTEIENPKLSDANKRPRVPRAETVYAIDVPTCLKKKAEELQALKDLRPDDRAVFDAALAKLSTELAAMREASLAAYNAAESSVTDADLDSLPRDSLRVQTQELFERAYGADAVRDKRRKIAADMAKEKIGMKYEEAIRDGLRSLKNLKWATTS